MTSAHPLGPTPQASLPWTNQRASPRTSRRGRTPEDSWTTRTSGLVTACVTWNPRRISTWKSFVRRAPHTDEVVGTFTLARQQWPGQKRVDQLAERGCRPRFEKYVGVPVDDSSLEWFSDSPVKIGWPEDRSVVCTAAGGFGASTGSVRGHRSLTARLVGQPRVRPLSPATPSSGCRQDRRSVTQNSHPGADTGGTHQMTARGGGPALARLPAVLPAVCRSRRPSESAPGRLPSRFVVALRTLRQHGPKAGDLGGQRTNVPSAEQRQGCLAPSSCLPTVCRYETAPLCVALWSCIPNHA